LERDGIQAGIKAPGIHGVSSVKSNHEKKHHMFDASPTIWMEPTTYFIIFHGKIILQSHS